MEDYIWDHSMHEEWGYVTLKIPNGFLQKVTRTQSAQITFYFRKQEILGGGKGGSCADALSAKQNTK